LRLAAIEDSNSTTGNLEVKVVVAQITSGVGDLDHHFLADDWTGGECDFVASAARLVLGLANDCSSSEAIGDGIVDHERNVVVANVGGATVAA